jgi:hypothetical protein
MGEASEEPNVLLKLILYIQIDAFPVVAASDRFNAVRRWSRDDAMC